MIKKDRIIKVLSIGVVLFFALLIYKDPFSQRTLIPNFEPYPDTFNYINPALSLITGKGFNISRESRVIKSNVPPLYSISLLPAFIIKPDPRMSYYSNVILAFIALFLFWSILRKIITNKFTLFFLLILYITNYFIYWVPSIIMAENLTLTFYLAAVYFLLSKTTKANAFMIALFAVGSYATKYANIPITLSIAFVFFGKTIFSSLMLNQKIKLLLFFASSIVLFFLSLGIFEALLQNNNIFTQIFEHFSSVYKSVPKTSAQGGEVAGSSWFGVQYVAKNLPLYINSLMGAPNRFLWDQTPLISKSVAIFGWVGIFGALLCKKMRYIAFSLILFLSTPVIFMSAFYSFDARYIYIAIPTLLIGLGLFLIGLESKILKRKIFFTFLIFVFICIYLINNFTRIKSQISLNLRYAETPWNYIAVLKMNEYFSADKIKSNERSSTAYKKPVLISALPPFLIDYYSNGNYTLLPLSYEQEFRGIKEIVWGPNDYSNLPNLYKKYINEGYEVYVSRAGLGNEGYTNRDFNTIVEEFDTKLVQQDCYDQCNIYSVKLKEKNGQ